MDSMTTLFESADYVEWLVVHEFLVQVVAVTLLLHNLYNDNIF